MSDPDPFAAPNEPLATNRFGTPIGRPGAAPPPDGDLNPYGQFASPYASPPANPYASPPANPYASPPPGSWSAPSTVLPSPIGPSGRSRPTWLVPVGALLVVVLVLIGGVAVAALRLSSRPDPIASGPRGPEPGSSSAPTPDRAVALPPALTAVPATHGATRPATLVTAASAVAIVDALWPVREQVLTSRDTAALAAFETGSALTGDQSRTECGCLVDHRPSDVGQVQVYVRPQPSYPASFMAEVGFEADDQQAKEVLVLTRRDATDPWRLAFYSASYYSRGVAALDSPAFQGNSDDVRATPTATKVLAASLPQRLAAYWTAAKRTGRVPQQSTFAPGPWTSQLAAQGAAHKNGTVQPNGLPGRLSYSARSTDPIYVTQVEGSTLACGLVHGSAAYVENWQVGPVQDEARQNWGPGLAPGAYREVDVQGTAQTCFYLADGTPMGPVSVVGGDTWSEKQATGHR